MKRITLREIFKKEIKDQEAVVKGWVRSVRKSKKFSFITLSDGTCQDNLQIIVDADAPNYEAISTMLTGTCVSIEGLLVESGGRQAVEMQGKSVEVLGNADSTYPIQKKGATLEFLREIAHLRPRTNLFGAVFRVRHELAVAVHNFFHEKGYFYLTAPLITAQDGEGAGEMFKVTTFDLDKELPRDDKGNIDYSKDYFGKETGLSVTGQLEGECFALGLGAIYTFGPSFRAENSNTKRHLSEFWHIEPEIAFADLEDVAELATDFIKHLIGHALDNCAAELEFLMKWNKETTLLDTLKHVRDSEFVKLTYTEAIEILNNSGKKFEFPTNWGDELQTEHEKFLTDEHFKLPVIVTDYPASCKAFYMKQNEDGKTVRAMDVLVPGIGEIIGGSQREESYEKICTRMDEMGIEKEDYWWYLDLRKYGSAPHAGFGLGFERLMMYITGMQNIRDVIPFPRTPNNAEF